MRGQTGVFGLGNVLTGQGNIKDSRENAHEIIERSVLAYLGIGDTPGPEALLGEAAARREHIANVIDQTVNTPKATPDELRAFMSLVYARWREVDYPGDYATWIERHRPG